MLSNCCGAEPSYLSDEHCGACLEGAEFYDDEDTGCGFDKCDDCSCQQESSQINVKVYGGYI